MVPVATPLVRLRGRTYVRLVHVRSDVPNPPEDVVSVSEPEVYEQRAREELDRLVQQNGAIEVLDRYYTCKMNCEMVFHTVYTVAHEEPSGVSDDVRHFARNLLDDWSK